MKTRSLASLALATALTATSARAAFHFIQIEQLIGGVDGNASAQAIQVRQRLGGQNQMQNASLWAADAAGGNRVLLLNIGTHVPTLNGTAGRTILFTTASFDAGMVQGGVMGFTGDYLLSTPIPAGYLSAGRLTFEGDGGTAATPGTIYWSLAWGGAGYTGSHAGTTNDDNGNYGPAFGSGLPTSSRQGIIFDGPFGDQSTTNLADYILSANPATVTRNDTSFFAVVPEPGSLALLAALGLGAFAIRRRRA